MNGRTGGRNAWGTGAFDFEAPRGPVSPHARRKAGISGQLALVASGIVLFLGWLGLWEKHHPAASAARTLARGAAAERLAAVQELEKAGCDDLEVAVPALVQGASDPNHAVRAAAATALGTVIAESARSETRAVEARRALDALLGALRDRQPRVRAAAAHALLAMTRDGPFDAIDLATIDSALEQLAGDPDTDVRFAAICGLGAIGHEISEEAPPALFVALEDESEKNRTAAARNLARFPRQVVRLIPSLVECLEEADAQFRGGYADILNQIRPPVYGEDAVPPLIAALQSADPLVQSRATASLAAFGEAGRPAVPALLVLFKKGLRAALRTGPGPTREAQAGPPAPDAIGLRPMFEGDRPSFGLPGGLGPWTLSPFGPDAEEGPEPARAAPSLMVSVTQALGRLAPGSPHEGATVAALLKATHARSAALRAAAAAALGRMRDDDALVGILICMLGDRAPAPRAAALRALYEIGLHTPIAAPEALAACLEARPAQVRADAAATLAHVGAGADPFLPALAHHALIDPVDRVREACAAALGELGPPAVTAAGVPALVAMVEGRDFSLRTKAVNVLGRLGPAAQGAVPALVGLLRAPAPEEDNPDANGAGAARWQAGAPIFRARGPWKHASPRQFLPAADFPGRAQGLRMEQRYWAVQALGRIAPGGPRADLAVAALTEALEPRETVLTSEAASALARFGPAAAPAVPRLYQVLEQAASEQKTWLIVWTAGALGRIDPDGPNAVHAIDALTFVLALDQNDDFLALKIAEALADFGPAAEAAAPGLLELLDHGPANVRAAAARALARIVPGTPREAPAIAALAAALQRAPDTDATPRILEALARFDVRAAAALPRIKQLEQSTNARVAAAARSARSHLEGPGPGPPPRADDAAERALLERPMPDENGPAPPERRLGPPAEKVFVGYLYGPPQNIDYSLYTHINHAFLVADGAGKVRQTQSVPSAQLTAEAHRAGVKVLLSLGGWGWDEQFAEIVADPEAEERYAQSVLKIVEGSDYDGLDLDWEYPDTAEEIVGFERLARRFRRALDALGEKKNGRTMLLTMAASANPGTLKWLKTPFLLETMDWINVMTYDYAGDWSSRAGHNAPLYAASRGGRRAVAPTLEHLLETRKLPPDRLALGIPLYGRAFNVAEPYASTKNAPRTRRPGGNYANIHKLLGDPEWKRQWDDAIKAPWLVSAKKKVVIGYDDAESVRLKTDWAMNHRLRGVFFWQIQGDRLPDGSRPLQEAARERWEKAAGTDARTKAATNPAPRTN